MLLLLEGLRTVLFGIFVWFSSRTVPPRRLFGIAEARTGNPAAAIILLTVACVLALLAAWPSRRPADGRP